MTILICGGSKSGKSMYAQRCARELAGNGKLYYLATMIPRDAEDIDRIATMLPSAAAGVLKRLNVRAL